MKKEDFVGVWKLLKYHDGRNGRILTSKTHLVVKEDILWEVHPNTTYYENQPGPEVQYTFESEPSENQAKLSLGNGFKYLVKKRGETLFMKLGPVYGTFPKNFADNGNLGQYELEEEELAKRIAILPKKEKVIEFKKRGFGILKYDTNLNWWDGHTKFQGKKIRINISAEEANKFEPLENIKERLKQLEPKSFEQIAAAHLLPLFNESWNNEEMDLTEDEFMKKVTIESITLEINGDVSIWCSDGDLFGGHSINISLDAKNEILEVGIMG